MSILEDARVIVFSILAIIGLIGFLIWWGSTGGHPTPEQTAEKLADEAIPFPIKLIQFLAEHLGESIIGALIIIGVVWFFYGGKGK